MLISLDLIKPSPNPVRTQWDEEKMNELAQSIKEQGLIVPIKVRPVQGVEECSQHDLEVLSSEWSGDRSMDDCMRCNDIQSFVWDIDSITEEEIVASIPFEIVYGHRRVEACKRAGLREVEAIVDGVDDNQSHVQAGIENLVRENMRPLEISEWCQSELNKGKTQAEVGAIVGKTYHWVSDYVALLNQTDEVKNIIERSPGSIKEKHVRMARHNTNGPEDVAYILEKVARENLGVRQTEQVAKAVKEAPTEQAKEKLLKWEFSPHIHDPELIKSRAETYGEHDPLYQDDKPSPQQQWDKAPEVKMMVSGLSDTILAFVSLLKEIRKTSKIEGKLAPEARQYMATKLRGFRDQINDLLLELEN